MHGDDKNKTNGMNMQGG